MNHDLLDEQLSSRTAGRMTLASVLEGYLREVRHAARVVDLELTRAEADSTRARIDIGLSAAPELVVSWTPQQGWFFTQVDEQAHVVLYRAGIEGDAASVVPEAEIVAGWLRVLASGDRGGHAEPPYPLDASDQALVERLATFGAGSDPYSP